MKKSGIVLVMVWVCLFGLNAFCGDTMDLDTGAGKTGTSPQAAANALMERVAGEAQRQWREVRLPKGLGSDPVVWQPRVSDPFPTQWPLRNAALIFYAYARGIQLRQATRGEIEGPIWAQLTVQGLSDSPTLTLLDTQIKPGEKQGLRPLTQGELQVLNGNPVLLLLHAGSTETDAKIRAYYCLQHALGNIPKGIKQGHAAFFEWLGCAGRQGSNG